MKPEVVGRAKRLEEPGQELLGGGAQLPSYRDEGLGLALRAERAQARSDLFERLVPGGGLERLEGALRTGAPKRCRDAVGVIEKLEGSLPLGAKSAAAHRMKWIAVQLDHTTAHPSHAHAAAAGT